MKKNKYLFLLLLIALPLLQTGCINNNDAALIVEQLQAPMKLRPEITVLMVNEQERFFAEGGVPPYQYKIKVGEGTMNQTTGEFTAPSTPQMVTLEISDANNQSFTTNIQIVEKLIISSPSSFLVETTSTTFTAAGGQPPYVFSTIMGAGTIDPSTGIFQAPESVGSAIIQVTDANGYTDSKLITIIPRIKISPESGNFPVNSKILFSALGGQPPVSFSVTAGNASIDSSNGLLTFGSTPSTVNIRATDSLGFTSEISVTSFYGKLVSTGGGVSPFSCGVNIYGKVQCWGNGFYLGYENYYWGEDFTQLGANLLPKYINNFNGLNVVDITNFGESYWNTAWRKTESEHACALFNDNSVRCWGGNDKLQLGFDDRNPLWVGPDKPQLPSVNLSLGGGVTVTKLAVGQQSKFSCALLSNGLVICWGQNGSYQVNPGTTNDRPPLTVNLGTGVLASDIKLGQYHVCALLTDKKVKCWGNNQYGQIGIGMPGTSYGDSGEMGDNLPFVAFGVDVDEIAVGHSHSCARLSSGSIKCWGDNSKGQLGLGVTTAKFGNTLDFDMSAHPTVDLGINPVTSLAYKATRVFAFGNRTCAKLEDGLLKCWGNNVEILGIEKPSTSPYDKIGDAPGEVSSNLSIVNLGTDLDLLDLNGYYKSTDRVAISTCAILLDLNTSKKIVKCWGRNSHGELGYGIAPTTNINIGDGANEMGDNLSPIDTGGLDVIKTSLGPSFSCALLSDNQVRCLGVATDTNGHGSPNKADQPSEFSPFSSAVSLGSASRVVGVYTKRYNSCALFEDGNAKCWGSNTFGQLGLGDTDSRGEKKDSMGVNLPFLDLGVGFKIKSMAIGLKHICALGENGRIKCWGSGANGKLGIGSTVNKGDDPGEMGDNLPPVNLGTDSFGDPLLATKVTVGENFSCALLENNKAKCWGLNSGGELGLNAGYNSGNPNIGDTGAEMGDSLEYVSLGTSKLMDISAGNSHVCAVLDDFTLKCWGLNTNGQLGYEDTVTRGNVANDMANLQTVNLGTKDKALSVFAGVYSTCVVMISGKLKCFGLNNFGQLGIESNLSNPYTATQLAYRIGDNFNEMGDNLPYVNLGNGLNAYFVAPEEFHTCAVLTNGEVKCWGLNNSGNLGYGDTITRGNVVNTMGDMLKQLFF